MWVKKSDGQMSDVASKRAEVEGLEYLFLPPALTLWSVQRWVDLSGQIYHYALPSVPLDGQVTLNLKGSILIGSWVHIT